MTVVVFHRYISAKWHLNKGNASTWQLATVAAVNKTVGHIDYIQHRPGVDREKHGREFFDEKDDHIDGKDVRKMAREEGKNRNIVAHKLMLSPDIQVPDLKSLTREVMQELSNEKGLDLNWKAVEHRNTEHPHVHILLMAKDRNGREVRLTKHDHDKIEKTADRILDRDYPWQRRELRLENEEKERLRQQILAKQDLDKFRFYELPWMKQKVVKELYQPYSEQDTRVEERRQRHKEFTEKPISIFDRQFSNKSTLEELQTAEKLLYTRGSKRLSVQDYRKFCAWKSDKELEATGRHAHSDPDKFEFQGKTFTKDTPVGELRAVRKFISETRQDRNPNNTMRLHSEDEAKLDEWLDDKPRALGVNSPEAAMKQALTQQSNEEKQYAESTQLLVQQEAMRENPVLAMFSDSESIDPRDKIAREKREQLQEADEQIADTLKDQEKAAQTDDSRTPEREQSIKRQKQARFTINRYLGEQTASDKERKRLEREKAHEKELDDWDFSIEW